MKIFRLIILVGFMFTYSNAGSISNPTQIINGTPMYFGTEMANNWYSFTVEEDTKIIILGSDNNGGSMTRVTIYNENLEEIFFASGRTSFTKNLVKGKYYLLIEQHNLYNEKDTVEGTFTVYSKDISNILDSNPQLGSIINPYLPKNGVNIDFGLNVATNVYFFEMLSEGNLLIDGSDINGGPIYSVDVYNENFENVFHENGITIFTKNLAKGKYYLVINVNTEGSFSIYSPSLGSTPRLPPVNTNYVNGYNAGKQYCIDKPRSCGYKPQVVVIPL